MAEDSIVIVGLARTPQGNLLGELKDFSAPQLGSAVIKAALERAAVPLAAVDEVLMGCVLPAAQGQAPARQAALFGGLSVKTGCTTINKMCGSGMKAVMLAEAILLSGQQKIIVAGGMESMSKAPYLLSQARQGYRLGSAAVLDHILKDGLEDAYEQGRPMGYFAEQCAKEFGFTRKEQDHYALSSFERARKAIAEKYFAAEIVALTAKTKEGEKRIDTDERPGSVKLEKLSQLPPAFSQAGSVTAGNSSSISDGAAALVLMPLSEAEKRGLQPLARIVAHSAFAKAPEQFTTAPIDAIRHLMEKIGWTVEQTELFEINEAFAVVTLAAMRELKIPREKVNIHGGGCALGHPIGATSARIIVTL
ncbi:MAG TPA: acetyl-CoA C-acyltransferase, partial [Gammaproteobacteria bacterium]|nr:acetyl-CoA C-acyltransferase [Gammaproteobacteria bacterium]